MNNIELYYLTVLQINILLYYCCQSGLFDTDLMALQIKC